MKASLFQNTTTSGAAGDGQVFSIVTMMTFLCQ